MERKDREDRYYRCQARQLFSRIMTRALLHYADGEDETTQDPYQKKENEREVMTIGKSA